MFVSIAALDWLLPQLGTDNHAFMLMGSLGASSILMFTRPTVSAAQPRNIIGGHMISALCGVVAARLLPADPITAAALAVSLALVIMEVCDAKHPPGGSTALIAVLDYGSIAHLGFLYVLAPVGLGALLLVIIGLMFNNMRGAYPAYWW